jgi:photosystem II stability/assembly factor-like uncharacterized protein
MNSHEFAKDYSPVVKNGWMSIGAGGGGALFHPKVSPHDKDTWMICCDMSETYITHDAGKHWRMLHLNGMVHDIAYDPVDPDVIYAGSSALYETRDRGLTWQLVLPVSEDSKASPGKVIGNIFKVTVDRNDPSHVYVACDTGIRRWGQKSEGILRVYASGDGAKTWKEIDGFEGSEFTGLFPIGNTVHVFTDTGYYRIAGTAAAAQPLPFCDTESYIISHAAAGVHPVTGQTVLYAVYGYAPFGPRAGKDMGMQSRVYRSLDGGDTWTEILGLDADFDDRTVSRRLVKDIAVSFNKPGRMYASLWRRPLVLPSCDVPGAMYDAALRHPLTGQYKGPVNTFGIMVSDDYGDTWAWSAKLELDVFPDNIGTGWYENAYDVDWCGSPWFIDASDNDPDLAFAALQGFAWITRDGGKTWNQTYTEGYTDGSWYGKSLESTTCYDVVFDPYDKDTLIITYTDNGMLKSTNGGKSWKHAVQGVPYDWINTCYKMVFDPDVKGRAWAVWTSVHDLPEHFMYRLHVAKVPPQAKGGVCITEDSADTWRPLTDLYKRGMIHTGIELDPVSPVNSRTLYKSVCPDGVYKSTDGGKTWELKVNGFGINKGVMFLKLAKDGKLYAVTMRTLTDEDVPADRKQAMWQGGIYVLEDGAETWREIKLPANVAVPVKIDFDPRDPSILYFTAYAHAGSAGGVYRSPDGGKTWVNLFDPAVNVHGIQIDPKHPAHIYIVTTEYAAYRSLNGGQQWERIRGYHFRNGKNPILDMHHDDMMYISTFGGSVFYGPRAGGTERYDDIDGFELGHRLG